MQVWFPIGNLLIRVIPLFLFLVPSLHAQTDSLFIEGKIIDARTSQPLPYTHVYNENTFRGTITNLEGYFKLKVNSLRDTLVCTFIGYQKQHLVLHPASRFYTIKLEESVNELKEVVVSAKDESYLIDLVLEVKENLSNEMKTGKAYFDLKSMVNNRQIEQVEGFYNVDVRNYDPVRMHIKTGRIALKEYNNRLFTSLESSRVFTMQKTFESNDYFPKSPLEFSSKKAKKYFSARLLQKYADDQSDTVLVISFFPKTDTTRSFTTTVWLKRDAKKIIKIQYSVNKASVYPFYPLFRADSIKSVDIRITKTFADIEEKPFINHVDFTYKVGYKSRGDTLYSVTTNAVLHIYDFTNSFELPFFTFSSENISDYRKINAIPHNDYFWKNNLEMRTNDQFNRNNEFYESPLSITNKKIFSANKYGPFGLMQHPYVQWSGKRILFKEKDTIKLTDKNQLKTTAKAQYYDLSVKIFLDVNRYTDTTQMISKTIFDPFESYFDLEMDRATQCFINIYFDLVEMERRKLVGSIEQSDKKTATIKKLYDESSQTIYYMKLKYFRETERGKNRDKLEKWNETVKKELKIDNMAMFFAATK